MRRLLILACSATKRTDPGEIPAWDRYTGPLWQTMRTHNAGERHARVAFLSAQYGLRDASTPIANYDARLTRTGLVRELVAPTLGCELRTMTRGTPWDAVAIVGGWQYLKLARAHLDAAQLAPQQLVTINGPIGQMRSALAQWLTASTSTEPPIRALPPISDDDQALAFERVAYALGRQHLTNAQRERDAQQLDLFGPRP